MIILVLENITKNFLDVETTGKRQGEEEEIRCFLCECN